MSSVFSSEVRAYPLYSSVCHQASTRRRLPLLIVLFFLVFICGIVCLDGVDGTILIGTRATVLPGPDQNLQTAVAPQSPTSVDANPLVLGTVLLPSPFDQIQVSVASRDHQSVRAPREAPLTQPLEGIQET